MRRAGSLTLSGGTSEDADEHDQAGKTMFWFFHGSFSAPIIKLLLHVTVVALQMSHVAGNAATIASTARLRMAVGMGTVSGQ